MKKLRALVVDDSAEVREFVGKYILEPHDFEVDVALDGAEGLKKALDDPPDLVLMDLEMPRMTGMEVLRELRRQNCRVPVILMTSHGSEEVVVEGLRLGVEDYLIKPFKPQELLDAIENAIAVARLQQDKQALTRRVVEANEQLKGRLDELRTLYEVGKSITALARPDKMLEDIVDAVLAVIPCEECSLVIIDSLSGKVRGHLTKRRSGNPTLPAQPEASSGVDSTSNGQRGERVLSTPLQFGQKKLGLLRIIQVSEQSFTAHQKQLLDMLADYATVAIRNMQLVRQIQRTKEKEKRQIRSLFERYVAPSVVEQALARPGQVSLGGTRQTITVLFADVRGFSTFSSHTSPEVLVKLLNQYMRVAADAVLAQEGTLDKFMGDAVMAFFNAPLPQPDHPIRAVRAGWALCQAVKKLHRHLPPFYHLHFGVGVGLGEAVVGNIGAPQLMNFTAIGDSVNKVKRLQENAEGGQILISQVTYPMVQEYIEARSVGEIHLKGQPYPEAVYEVLDVE